MVLIDFLNKTIPGGDKKQPGGGKILFFPRFARNLAPPGYNPVYAPVRAVSYKSKLKSKVVFNVMQYATTTVYCGKIALEIHKSVEQGM